MAGQSSKQPMLPKGFEFLGPLMQDLGGLTHQQFGQIFGGGSDALSGGLDQLGQQQQGLMSEAAASVSGLGGPSNAAFLQGLDTGFAPDVVQQLQSKLAPGVAFAQDRLFENVQGSAEAMGLGNSTGTLNQQMMGAQGIENNALNQIAQFQGNAELQGQNIRANMANQGINSAMNTAQGFTNPIGQAVQQGQFGQSLPLQALGALQGGVGSLPLFTPAQGPSPAPAIGGAIGAAVGSGFPGLGTAAGAAIGTGAGSLFAK